MNSYNLEEYEEYIRNFDPFKAEAPKSGLWRHLGEHIIFTIAPVLGGCRCRIKLQGYPEDVNFARSVAEISSGRILSFPAATFPELVRDNPNILLSEPILLSDEFYVGLFTHSNRKDILALTDLDKIRNLRFVTVHNWDIDQKILADRGFREVRAANWKSAMRMLQVGRADVIMQPFGTGPDMSFIDSASNERFYPIPGVKLLFPYGRAYMVSARHPRSSEFLGYLNTGIRKMKASGLLQAHLMAAGVISPRIDGLQEL
ncbi:MAG: hypothetical protein ACK5II_01215 [Paracoccus sp. (in: a-proteobacteria)]